MKDPIPNTIDAAVLLVIRVAGALTFRLTLHRWRYVSVPDVARLVLASGKALPGALDAVVRAVAQDVHQRVAYFFDNRLVQFC